MLKVALISEHASPLAPPGSIDSGGQNVYVSQVARCLARAGHQVDVFTRRDHASQPVCVPAGPGVRVIHVPAGPARTLPKEQLLPHMDAFVAWTVRFLREQNRRYDVAHAHFFMSGLVAREWQRVFSLPFVITFHALGRVRRQAQGKADGFPPGRGGLEAVLMRQAARVIAECPQDCDDMVRLYGAPRARMTIVPAGFDPGELWPARAQGRRRLGLSDSEFVVLQLGRMVPRKGVDTVITAVAHLARDHGLTARLLVAGGGARAGAEGQELERLRLLARQAGLAARVRFAGSVPRASLRHYYSAADVFVSTPWYEPFGITPLEAMACATPVIGAAVGGLRSTVLDGQTGFLVPPRDPAAVAGCLAELARQPARARELGRAGWHRAHRHFTWERVTAQLLSVYRQVLAREA